MTRRIEFHRLALHELRTVASWYRSKSIQAREQFLIRLDQALLRVGTDPESFPILGRTHRYVRVRGFPYQIVFQIQADFSQKITAIAHTSRRPGYWRHRR